MERCNGQYESMGYRAYHQRSEINKALNTLAGVIRGITIDNEINETEIKELKAWCASLELVKSQHPYTELVPVVLKAIEDNYLSSEEVESILWLIKSFSMKSKYTTMIRATIQKLHGIFHGIISDGVISDEEIIKLKKWINENEQLAGCYPYDEINSLLTDILKDRIVTDIERNRLMVFFSDFVDLDTIDSIDPNEIEELKKEITIGGICAVCPDITIEGKTFCFTGVSSRGNRRTIKDTLESMGGIFTDSVTKKLNYLIVGDNGNPCWLYSCYGNKVEKAVKNRKAGLPVVIIHENDFWDAIEDYLVEIS